LVFIDFSDTVLPWVGRLNLEFTYLSNKKFREQNINLSKEQWVVLKYLYQKDGLIQNDLAFITSRDKTSMTRLINNMEKNALIRRENCAHDKRINLIYIEDKGRQLFEKTLPIMQSLIDVLQKGIPRKSLEQTIEILKTLETNLLKYTD
jgi:DNA-binding MarR family transcriptional regulator